jgi:DNA-binding NtrC family response regulator
MNTANASDWKIILAMGESVLIVDDEENLLVLLHRVLGKVGYDVTTASNSQQALELIEKHDFPFAILDIRMFPIDGVALLSEIKKRSPATKVIMITAYPTADSRSECFRRGAATYLTKPLDTQELKKTLENLALG